MWQMVLAHISVQGWIIDPYVYSLFNCSNLVQVLPPNNFKIVDGNFVTTDVTMEDGAMPFLDILVSPGRDGSLSTSVYRKPTHTDLYLQWESHHPLSSKYSVIGTLQHRANTICSSPQLLQKEEETPATGTDEMSIPKLGPEQSQTQDEKPRYKSHSQQQQ